MKRRSTVIATSLVAVLAMAVFSSASFAAKAEKTSVAYGPVTYDTGSFYFGVITCTGKHQTNSIKYPGSGSRGGRDVFKCVAPKGSEFPLDRQTPGGPFNIDGNTWNSDFDGEESFDIVKSHVALNDKSFTATVVYPYP